jgi:CspA family cold shock protein
MGPRQHQAAHAERQPRPVRDLLEPAADVDEEGPRRSPREEEFVERRLKPEGLRAPARVFLADCSGCRSNLGFIQPDTGGKDVFVHISAVEKAGMDGLPEGAKITYDIISDRGKESAGNLQLK